MNTDKTLDNHSITTSWFTFGQSHVHSMNGRTFDKDVVVKITSEDPRVQMVQYFGTKWSFEYDKEPDMEYFKEVVEL